MTARPGVLDSLTGWQRQIVILAVGGMSQRGIADHLSISVSTVHEDLRHAYAATGTSGRGARRRLAALWLGRAGG